MKVYKTGLSVILLLCASSFALAAGPIVISDGPDPSTLSSGNTPKVVVSDGPMEWSKATRAGKRLTGVWVVESDGPGTGRLVGATEKQPEPSLKPIGIAEADHKPSTPASQIVISDGPSDRSAPGHGIVTSDGPSESPATKTHHGIIISDGPSPRPAPKNGIVVSDGPGTSSMHEQKTESHAEASVPDPNTSALAVFIPAQNSLQALMPEKMVAPVTQTSLQGAVPIDTREGLFYIYSDKQVSGNHFLPSGWMGDYRDIRFDDSSRENPHSGKTCIKITYNMKNPPEAGWIGIYWQYPANNWGDKKGGYNLRGYHRLTFWARGAKGGELISEFKMGGITGERGDTAAAGTGSVVLTKEWKLYTISLKDQDLAYVIGGFSWAASRDDNPEGLTFYLDDIRYE